VLRGTVGGSAQRCKCASAFEQRDGSCYKAPTARYATMLRANLASGAGHFGGLMPIGERFAAFVPVGRTYDPDTDWDWEGRGVAPDVQVPADQALEVALARARER
jgi:hypothetical protein